MQSPRRKGRIVGRLATLSLALGIGGNAVVFSIANSFLFKPLPYRDVDGIVLLGERQKDQPALVIVSLTSALSTWADYRAETRLLTEWAAFQPTTLGLFQGDASVPVSGARVTPGFFPLLGTEAVHGRLFTEMEGVEGGPRVALVTWEYWQRAMGGGRPPLGAVLRLNGEPFQVIGVLQEGFEFIVPAMDIWIPLQQDPQTAPRGRRNVFSVARMAPGATMAQVRDELSSIGERIAAEYPETHRGWIMAAYHLSTEFPDTNSRRHMALIQGALLFVLLIACANVANLLLVRSQEIAVCLVALGAGSVLVRTFMEVRYADPGFVQEGLLTVQLDVPTWRYPDESEALVVLDRIRDRASALSGVVSAAWVSVLPQHLDPPTDTFRIESRPVARAPGCGCTDGHSSESLTGVPGDAGRAAPSGALHRALGRTRGVQGGGRQPGNGRAPVSGTEPTRRAAHAPGGVP